MLLRLGKAKKKSSPTWRHEEKEYNPAWRQKETGQDATWRQRKMVRNNVSTAWRRREKEKNAQVVCVHSPWIRHGTTQGRKNTIAKNKKNNNVSLNFYSGYGTNCVRAHARMS